MATMTGERPPTSGGPMFDVRDVNRAFHSGGSTVHAVKHVTLEVPRGEFLAIVGRSGSGKTTLLNLMAGLDKPDSGAVYLDGQEISAFNEKQMTKLRRESLGFVFQSFGLLPLLSAAENVELALRIAGAGLRQRSERTAELLELVGLSHRADHRPYELSGGEQQRVAVARALANKPPVLIADEPTGELDSTTGAQIFQLLRSVANQGVTIVTATHDPFVMEHVDRVVEMSDGELLPEGTGTLVSSMRRDASGASRPLPQPPAPAQPPEERRRPGVPAPRRRMQPPPMRQPGDR